MKVVYIDANTRHTLEKSCVALGYFDGLHKGHQRLLEEVRTISNKEGLKKGIMTFTVHPKSYMGKQTHHYLTTLDDKVQILEKMGFEYLFVIPFNMAFSTMEATTFIQKYILDLQVQHVVCGFDYRFGYQGMGNGKLLQETKGIGVTEVPRESYVHRKISSSYIKECIQAGDVSLANALLGREYAIHGEVLHGFQRGSTELGFPTANVAYETYVLPKIGVYAVAIEIQGCRYEGMANIGYNPTFGDLEVPSLEVHIFDFEEMIYGERIHVFFYQRIRGEQKFISKETLIIQLQRDQQEIRTFFNK